MSLRLRLTHVAVRMATPPCQFTRSARCALVVASTTSVSWCPSPITFAARRYTNILYRLPPANSVPTHSPSGEEIDTELFMEQFKGMIEMIRMTQLTDMNHEMRSCPYFECIFSNDLMFQHYDLMLPMPKFGREFRSSEISETLRHMRGCGASGDFNHILQESQGARATGNDFVSTTHGILMGYNTAGTNKLAAMAMTGAGGDEQQQTQMNALNVIPIEMLPDSPPLAEVLGFAGSRTLIVEDSIHGHHAAEEASKVLLKLSCQVLKLEKGCSFLTHLCGANYVYDVLCDQDFPESMERLGESGLNPFPVAWSEPRKLGISMRSVCLVARFARGTMSGGGYANSSAHHDTGFNYNSRNVAKNAKLFTGGHRKHGDSGAPLEAQMRSGELPEPVFQPKPRYAPPMHRDGGHVVPRS